MKHVTQRHTTATGLGLLALWAGSWALSYADLGHWSFVVALGIAALKVLLVALFFMELVTERAPFNFAVLSALTMIAVMIAFTVGDIATRAKEPLAQPVARHPLSAGTP